MHSEPNTSTREKEEQFQRLSMALQAAWLIFYEDLVERRQRVRVFLRPRQITALNDLHRRKDPVGHSTHQPGAAKLGPAVGTWQKEGACYVEGTGNLPSQTVLPQHREFHQPWS